MKSVRVQPAETGLLLVDVVCDCGSNGLTDFDSNESSFRHKVLLGGKPMTLRCDCGKRYLLTPQSTHIHVSNIE